MSEVGQVIKRVPPWMGVIPAGRFVTFTNFLLCRSRYVKETVIGFALGER